jgi:hypothetical protein
MKYITLILLAIAFNATASEPEQRDAIKALPSILALVLSEPVEPCEEYRPLPEVDGEPPIAIDPPVECGGKDWSRDYE